MTWSDKNGDFVDIFERDIKVVWVKSVEFVLSRAGFSSGCSRMARVGLLDYVIERHVYFNTI